MKNLSIAILLFASTLQISCESLASSHLNLLKKNILPNETLLVPTISPYLYPIEINLTANTWLGRLFSYEVGEEKIEYCWEEKYPKRIFILGSSTVHAGWWRGEDFNDPYGDNRVLEGWGEELNRYLKEPSQLYNQARLGSHSIRYRTPERRPYYASRAGIIGRDWNSTEALIEATEDNNGGFLLIQFGAAESYSGVSVEDFEKELRAYVADAQRLNLTPVLITPPTRRDTNNLDNRSYAKYIKPIAENENLLFLDLYEKSKIEFGKYLARDANLSLADKDFSYQQHFNGVNATHFGRNGAKIVAGWVRELACESYLDRSTKVQEDARELCEQFVEGELAHLISMREDAEDGDIDDWETYGITEGATVKNIYDPAKRSNVIELQGGDGVGNGFRYAVTNLWEEEEKFVLSWDMNYSEDFTFFVSVDTEDGYKIFEYKPSDSAGEMVAGRYRFGLGSDVADGRWHTFVRDLQADLQSIDPSKHILKIHRIAIRGSGRLDNIQTMKRVDAVRRDIAPTVAVIGKAEISLNRDDAYIEAGVTVVDDRDSNLSSKVETIGSVDSSTLGDYTILYKVHDSVGNGGYAKRTVHVVDPEVKEAEHQDQVAVDFVEYPKPLKNPLKGFMIMANKNSPTPKTYVTLQKRLIHWNDIERTIEDGVDKIISYSQDHLYTQSEDQIPYNVEDRNLKSIPVVVLKKSKNRTYAPDDMDISEHDNQTEVYIDRIKNLVPKLAKAWDDDPRIGFVYMAIHGLWGEQLSPVMTPEVAQALGDSFSQHFHHKKVLVRVPHYFNQKYLQAHDNRFHGNSYTHYYEFGMFWDAFAWPNELGGLLDTDEMIAQTAFWRDYPLLGETSLAGTINGNNYQNNIYDYSNYPSELPASEKVKRSIHDTLTHESSLDYLTDYIKATHCTALSWIAQYNEADAGEARGAEALQKAMGYRFVLKHATYSDEVDDQKRELKLSFNVENHGSAPFYYPWPVEVSLLKVGNREKVWSHTFSDLDIRTWQPGDQWDFDNNSYKIAPKTYHIEGTFEIANNLPKGEYILALSILDPAGMQPAVKFAVNSYYKGGRTPLGMVGIGSKPEASLPPFETIADDGLRYEVR